MDRLALSINILWSIRIKTIERFVLSVYPLTRPPLPSSKPKPEQPLSLFASRKQSIAFCLSCTCPTCRDSKCSTA
jgi:hypothetical protein